jgi:hypothetical protein
MYLGSNTPAATSTSKTEICDGADCGKVATGRVVYADNASGNGSESSPGMGAEKDTLTQQARGLGDSPLRHRQRPALRRS